MRSKNNMLGDVTQQIREMDKEINALDVNDPEFWSKLDAIAGRKKDLIKQAGGWHVVKAALDAQEKKK